MSMEQHDKCLVQSLHEDVLADVLRRLAPRSLAAARCVCKAWRAAIDDRRLLRAELLPRSLGGIFVEFNMLGRTEFFSASSSRGGVSGDLSYTPDVSVEGHCNGLVLLYSCVANPATRQWAHLPEQPRPRMATDAYCYYELPYLVFDPTLSPSHYEVFLIPVVPMWAKLDPVAQESEWLPPLLETHVFSSRTGRWEERSFLREGEAAGTMADMQRPMDMGETRYGVYWHGALYVHCQNHVFCRISTSDGSNKYRVIQAPMGFEPNWNSQVHLGRSENGVYCALLDLNFRLRVWILRESTSGHMEWELKHQKNLQHVLESLEYTQQDREESWIFEDLNYYTDYYHGDRNNEEEPAKQYKFNEHSYVDLLGFHPFKEIVFLSCSMTRGVAYDMNSSKAHDLGNMLPKHYYCIAGQHAYIRASFPYTPCWMEDPLPAFQSKTMLSSEQ